MFYKETFAPCINSCRLAFAKLINKCYNYNKLGHFTFSCPELKKANLYKIEEGLVNS